MKSPRVYRFIFYINVIFALLMLLLYATSFISPKSFRLGGLLNLMTPIVFIVNLLFLLFWLIRLKRYFLLSFAVLLLGWFHLQKSYKFSRPSLSTHGDFSVMSYNVMQFYSLTDKYENTYAKINAFVDAEYPDIIGVQEFSTSLEHKFNNYPYRVQNDNYQQLKTVILSRHPIVNSKLYDFISNNSAVFADIAISGDTIRVFSIHFESLNLKTDLDEINEKSLLRKYEKLQRVFPRQIDQLQLIKDDIETSPYPVVICSDLNNTPLSNIYRRIIDLNLQDSFLEKGSGYGKTFALNGFPLRIDMIFASPELPVYSFKNFEVSFSDHYPIMASFGLNP